MSWTIISGGSTKIFKDDLDFTVEQQPGTGVAEVENLSTPFGLVDGSVYQRTRATERTFSLIGTLAGSSVADLHNKRRALIDMVRPKQESLVFQYSGASTTVQGSAFYVSGMELGDISARIEKKVGLQFLMTDPYWEQTTNASATLTVRQAISSTGRAILRKAASGAWSAISGAAYTNVYALERSKAGTSVCDLFAAIFESGAASPNRVIEYDGGTTWSNELRANSTIYTLSDSPDENLYFGGAFTAAEGGAACAVAYINNGAITEVGTGLESAVNGTCFDLGFNNRNTLFAAVGREVFLPSFGASGRLAQWNGTTWSQSGSGDSEARTLAFGQSGDVFVGGDFQTWEGISRPGAYRQYVISSSAWTNASTYLGFDNTESAGSPVVTALIFDRTNQLYAAGDFDNTDGDTSVCRLAKFQNPAWIAMGKGLNNQVNAAVVLPNNDVVFSGSFAQSGNINIGHLARWNGTAIVPFGVVLTGGETGPMVLDASATFYVGMKSLPTSLTTEAIISVTNSGTANTYPILSACGPGRFYMLSNYTTDRYCYFNLTLLSGEVLTVDFRPGKRSVDSNIRGNLLNTIMPGSDFSNFYLTAGSNAVGVFIDNANAAAKLSWFPRFWSVDA